MSADTTQSPTRDPRGAGSGENAVAQRNEAANDQLNAIQVTQNRRVRYASNALSDPDYLREVSMETAQTALHAHDPEQVKKNHEEMAKRMKARQEREAKAAAK